MPSGPISQRRLSCSRLRGLTVRRDRTFPVLRERQTQIFALSALALIAYRFDHAFVNGNPGTSAGDSATLWQIPESRHIKGIKTVPTGYEWRAVEFFDAALLGR